MSALLVLLAALTCVLWAIAARQPQCRVRMQWMDQGSVISNTVHAVGWDKDGFFSTDIAERCYPGMKWPPHMGEDNTLQPVRDFLHALSPPEQILTRWAPSPTHYAAYLNLYPGAFAFGGGSRFTAARHGPSFPLLLVVLLTFPVLRSVLFVVRSLVRRKAVPRGVCPVCRYDLTGNISGVCPECGTAIAAQARNRDVTTL